MQFQEKRFGHLDNSADCATIDITVPYSAPNRHQALASEWRRQGGDAHPIPPLQLPGRNKGSYTVRIQCRQMVDLAIHEMYSDAAAGRSGGPNGYWENQIVILFQFSGAGHFATSHQTFTTGAGSVSVRRNEVEWEYAFDHGSRATALILPAQDLIYPKRGRAFATGQNTPAARLLLAHFRHWTSLSADLSSSASRFARNAALELFHALLNDQIIDDEPFSPAFVGAAMEYIERRLEDPDLDPRAVADSLHVSVRSLHRAFTNESISVMGYVRERRLERARQELMTTPLTVTELAARWHFTDNSHFVRAYKKRFDEAPAALRHRHGIER